MPGGTTTFLQQTFGSTLDEATIATVRTMAKRVEHPPGTVLCHQGQVEDTFYIIVDGRVVVTQKREGETEDRILAFLGPNEYFGEMGLLDNEPSATSCMVTKKTAVFEVTKELFSQIVERSPAVAMAITLSVLGTLRRTTATSIEELRKKNTELEQAYTDLKQAQAKLVEQEKLERELELASQVQRTLLPRALPKFADCAFAAHLRPARQVGGDLYNVIPLEGDRVGFVLADVSDKGMQAALFMAIAQALFGREGRRSPSPREVAQSVHAGILDVAPESEVFLTAIYGVLHRPTRRLTYVRAGHDHPILLRPGQAPALLPGEGRFLGMIEGLSLEEKSVTLQRGDRLLLYSDGATDATDRKGQMFGKERLMELLARSGSVTAEQLVQRIVSALAQWIGNNPPFDDVTLLVLEMR